MGILVVLVIVLLLAASFNQPSKKARTVEEMHRERMARYANMPLKDYWRAVEHEIMYERFTDDGKLEWKQSVLRWRGDPKKERYINLISVRANIERVDMDMPLDEYAMFYYGRLVAEHGEEWYIKRINRPYHMMEYESLELFDEDGNQYHYYILDTYERNEKGDYVYYVKVTKIICGDNDRDCQTIGRINITKAE